MKTTKQMQKNIPVGWQEVRLGDIGFFSKGAGILKDDVTDTGFNAVRYGELYTRYHFQIKQIHSHILETVISSTKKIKYGDILFAGSGETIDEIGKSAAYLLKETCYAGGDIIVFTSNGADSLFLSYFLNVGEARKKLRELGQGQSVVHIYKKDLENLKLHLPPIEEQKRIVGVLEAWDKAIEKLAKKIELKKNIKKGLIQQLLTGKKRLPGFTDEWQIVKLGDLGIFRGGNGFPEKYQGNLSGEYPFYKVSDMNNIGNESQMTNSNNWIDHSTRQEIKATIFPANTIVIAKIGAALFLERKRILTQESCIDNI